MTNLLRLILLAVLVFASAVAAQELSEAEYRAKLNELQKNIETLQEELNSVKGNRDELMRDLKNNETDIGELLKKIDNIKQELESEEQALKALHQKREQLAGEQQTQKKHVAQQVRAAYQLGGQSNLKLLLNQDKPDTVSRMLKYHDYFVAAHTGKIAGYIDNIVELNAIEPQILRNQESLQHNRQQLETRHQQLKNKRSEREKCWHGLMNP
ncbi:MAG: hypothetical protein WDZ30_08325 [Cellvibrionaceae bacterium]